MWRLAILYRKETLQKVIIVVNVCFLLKASGCFIYLLICRGNQSIIKRKGSVNGTKIVLETKVNILFTGRCWIKVQIANLRTYGCGYLITNW